MKKLRLIVMSLTLSAFMAFSAWAGEWKQDTAGWRYDSGNSVYLNGGWQWIDGKCYYFTPEGYCLTNTITPDGNTVDSSGAWIIGGVVQTQMPDTGAPADTATQVAAPQVYTIGNLSFAIPDGFSLIEQDEDGYLFASGNQIQAIFIGSFDLGENLESYLSMDGINYLFDLAMEDTLGAYDSKTARQLVSGTWLRYDYAITNIENFSGSINVYLRLKGSEMQGVIFIGDYSNVDLDGITNTIIK